jgi:ATP-dependent Lon protease
MSVFDAFSDLPADFEGQVRLFPLPNLVLFPHVLQPLHIHESRYCEMLEDALADDQLIGMALLEPGWEYDYAGRPPVAGMICVGKVVSHAREGQDRHNILLLGVRRARIQRELPAQRSFRQAVIRYAQDEGYDDASGQQRQLKRRLVECFRGLLPKTRAVREQCDQLLSSQVSLGVLTDIVAFTVNLDVQMKQLLLEETDADQRAATLLDHLPALKDTQTGAQRFPPEFSEN